MTGRIKSIGFESGFIQLENGSDAAFEFSDVLTYDRANLAVDQFVSFDIRRGTHAKAVNIVVEKQMLASRSGQKRRLPRSFRYLGFEQIGTSRAYRFEEVIPGEQKKVFIVTIDTGLFKKHRVGIQEGPALCLRLLMEVPDFSVVEPCSISDQDMLLHVARRPVVKNGSRTRTFSYIQGVGVRPH
jgi:hypothetical protein